MVRRHAIVLLLVLVAAAVLSAQQPQFEVASIKPNRNPAAAQNARVLPGGRVEVTNMPLRTLVRIAYGLTGPQVTGGPDWVNTDGFDIVAKAAGDAADSGQSAELLAMLKALLTDRFGLKVHFEIRETQTYALVLANKNGTLGPALRESHADCSGLGDQRQSGSCGIRGGNGNITYAAVSMSQIATSIAGFAVVRRPIMDRTGLVGRYDLHLVYNNGDSADPNPSIFTALVEQAGLRLDAERGTVEVLVIDRAERPKED